jgi:hypothetical protein
LSLSLFIFLQFVATEIEMRCINFFIHVNSKLA